MDSIEAVDVSIVLPCLNEADSVGPCIDEATAALAASPWSFEIIVVDNGSDDGSDVVALRHGARVVYEAAPGYGSALRRGITDARGQVVVMADADCSYELSKIPALVAPVVGGEADLVLGERLSSASRSSMPTLHRFVGTPVLSALVRRAAGTDLDVRDSQSGFRAFRKADIDALRLRGTGMEFASEMLIRAARHGMRITEIPTVYRDRVGESKLDTFSDGFRHLQLILLMAPALVLRLPGIAMLATGLGFTGLAFLQPSGMNLGSLQWQPVFAATVLIVLGTLALLGGVVLEHHSPLIGPRPTTRWSPFASTKAAGRVAVAGAAAGAIGLALDVALLVVVDMDRGLESQRMAAASLATSLIIVGAVCGVAGFVGRILLGQLAYLRDEQLRSGPAVTVPVPAGSPKGS